MQKKICLVLTLTIVYLAESLPYNANTLEFDNVDSDLSDLGDLGYEVEEDYTDDYSKLLDNNKTAKQTSGPHKKNSAKSKTTVRTSGFKKKNTENAGSQSKHNFDDIKKLFKQIGVHDQGAYNDDNAYGVAEGITAAAAGAGRKETTTYRRGTRTKGFHRVHHKDEYKKDQEFFEDGETKGTVNKIGAKVKGIKAEAGAGFNKGHFNHDREKGLFAKEGYSDTGSSDNEFNVYSDSLGFDGSFSEES